MKIYIRIILYNDNNCTYDSIDIENMTIICYCQVKTDIETDVKEPSFKKEVIDIFRYSTFKVIQCYKLVFNLNNKKKNIGFLIFSILVLLHLPLFFHYIIFSDISIKTYIKNEFIKYKYSINRKNRKTDNKNNPIKKLKRIKKNFSSQRIIKLNDSKKKQ